MNKRSLLSLLLVLTLPIKTLFAIERPSIERIQLIDEQKLLKEDSLKEISLLRLNGSADEQSSKLDANYILACMAMDAGDYANAKRYLQSANDLAAAQLDSIFRSHLKFKKGRLLLLTNENQSAVVAFKEALELALHTRNSYTALLVANSYYEIAESESDLWYCYTSYKRVLTLADSTGDKNAIHMSLMGLMRLSNELGNVLESYSYAMEGLEKGEKIEDALLTAHSNHFLGKLLTDNKEYASALEYLNKAKNGYELLNQSLSAGLVSLDMGKLYFETQGYLSAKIHAKSALDALSRSDRFSELASIYVLYSGIHYNQKEYDTSIAYGFRTLDLEGKLESKEKRKLAEAHLFIGKSYFQKHNPLASVKHFQLGILIADQVQETIVRSELLTELVSLYDFQKNYRKSLEYSKELNHELINLSKKGKTKVINSLQVGFLQRNEMKAILAEKNSIVLAQNAELSEQKSKFNATIIGFLIVFLFTVALFKMYCNKRTKAKELEVYNSVIKDQADKLQEIDDLKSRFFTNISHEFRTPLTLISGPAEQLELKLNGEDATKICSIRKNTKRLLKLVNQILELAELRSEKRSLKLTKVSIRPFMQQIKDSFDELAKSRNIELKCYINAIQPSVCIEQDSVEKMVVNLLSNAFKFSDDGGLIVLNVLCSKNGLEIRVKDNGIGIGEEEKKNIFDMFYYTESDQSVSSGIGLSLVSALVSSHGGEIFVDSKKGEGAIFKIILPTQLEIYEEKEIKYTIYNDGISDYNVDSQKGQDSIVESVTANGFHPDTLMIVDDNHEIRNYIHNLLGDKYKIIAAKNGIEGIEKAKEFIPDLILCDIMMPELNGFELVKELKSDEKTSHIPIILLTAKVDKESKIEGLSLKADDYLTKPFDQHELLIRIENLIQNRKHLQERMNKDLIFNPSELAGPSTDQVLIERVLMIVEERIDDSSLSVDELAREVGMSRSQLHRKIVALTGKSTSIFIRNIRLRVAHEMLLKNVGNVSEISDRVGFSSPSYFNRCFKDMYGVPPSTIMNQAIQEKVTTGE